MRVLITGASGSGQTTLTREIALRLQWPSLDTDDFYWVPSEPPYTIQRTNRERHDLLLAEVKKTSSVIVAGSIVGWGDELEVAFDLVVFLYVPTEIRMERLRRREISRFGRIDPEFETWAMKYDDPDTPIRSLALHEAWLSRRSCSVLKLAGANTISENAGIVLQHVRAR